MRSNLFAALSVLVLLAVPSTSRAQAAATGFLDRTVTIAGETYRYQVYVPADYTRSRAWPRTCGAPRSSRFRRYV